MSRGGGFCTAGIVYDMPCPVHGQTCPVDAYQRNKDLFRNKDIFDTAHPIPMSGARFSADRVYRYALWRTWDVEKPRMMVIGLNPSTADETTDDPTIRRCISFAKRDGFGGLSMLNLFAMRSTRPDQLTIVPDPIGAENDRYLAAFAVTSRTVVCAWGAHSMVEWRARGMQVSQLLRELGVQLSCFGVTKGSMPRHPLYLPRTTPIVSYGP
jgi:hypothetical protein